MFILQLPACRVNAQTAYIFQLFLCRYVSSLDTKNPGERVLLGAGCNYCAAVLVSSKPMAT